MMMMTSTTATSSTTNTATAAEQQLIQQSQNVDLSYNASIDVNTSSFGSTLLQQQHQQHQHFHQLSSRFDQNCWISGMASELRTSTTLTLDHDQCNNSNSKRSHEEDVYEDLCYVTLRSNQQQQQQQLNNNKFDNGNHQQHQHQQQQQLQLNQHYHNQRHQQHNQQHPQQQPQLQQFNEPFTNKRDYCIKELVETEKNYCDALEMIMKNFVEPLTKSMNLNHSKIIFNNLPSLIDLHSKFYQDLYQACNFGHLNNNSTTVVVENNNDFFNNKKSCQISCSMPSLTVLNSNNSSSSFNNRQISRSPMFQQQQQIGSSSPINSIAGVDCGDDDDCEKRSLSSLHQQQLILDNNNNNNNNRFSSIKFLNCFQNFHNKFLIYGQYCANLPKAQQLLDELCSLDQNLNQLVLKCQNKANDGRFKLRDLLSLPMQRILKYHLLLGELLRNTTTNIINDDDNYNYNDDDDYQNLRKAYESMLDIGAYINEVKRDTEMLEIIQNVQKSIIDLSMPDNYELKDYGRLIKDGEVKMRSFDDPRSTKLKNRYIFIFDKVVLMCKTLRARQYSYKEAIILEDYKLEELPTFNPISKLTKNWSSGWSLVRLRTKQPYTFYVKNDEIKRKWCEAIEQAQENVRPKILSETDHQFAMSTVPVATCCASCRKLLKGTWYQGYLCYVCNVIVHKQCINKIDSCARIHNNRNSLMKSNNWFNTAENTTNTAASNNTKANANHNAPPTPSRCCRKLVKANFSNHIVGQLCFEPNDTIIVYDQNHDNHGNGDVGIGIGSSGSLWYGRNLRTGQQGTFDNGNGLVSEIVTDSPSSSSIDSPTVSTLPFSYDDQSIASELLLLSSSTYNTNNANHNNATTLPRKFSTLGSNTPSPQSILSITGTATATVSGTATSTSPPSSLISPLALSNPSLPTTTTTTTAIAITGNNNGKQVDFLSNDNQFKLNLKSVNDNHHNNHHNNSHNNNNPALVKDGNLRMFFGNGYNLEEYAWFAGPMERELAQTTLNPLPNGSFLVRISEKQHNSYAISINYNGQVKHMRVQVTYLNEIKPTLIGNMPDTGSSSPSNNSINSNSNNFENWKFGPEKPTHFYLSERRYFRTIVDLVRWYELNSLSESFSLVNSKLLLPYKKAYCHEILGDAIALYAFTGTSSVASSFLSLRKGDRITVLSRAAEDKGWWKGQIGDRIGYFPFKYVTPLTNSLKIGLEFFNKSSNNNKIAPNANNPNNNSPDIQRNNQSNIDANHQDDDAQNDEDIDGDDDNNHIIEPEIDITAKPKYSPEPHHQLQQSKITQTNSIKSPQQIITDVSSTTSSSSSSSSSEATTLSSPINSDTISIHSRQASSDAGIEIVIDVDDDNNDDDDDGEGGAGPGCKDLEQSDDTPKAATTTPAI